MNNNKYKSKKKYDGFSFLEAIISVFILAVGIVAVLPLLTTGIRDSSSSRDQMIAVFLAQEGVELVENFRDNNWAEDRDAFDGERFPANSKENCAVSWDSSDLRDCNAGKSFILYMDGNGYYTYSGASETRFRRKVIIEYFDASGGSVNMNLADWAKITSVATWGGSIPDDPISVSNCSTYSKCVFAEAILTKWR